MGSVDRGLIMVAGSRSPNDGSRSSSIRRLTDDAITRFTLASLPPRRDWPSGRRRLGAEVLLAHHDRPADARQLVGQGHGRELARLIGKQLGDPGILAGPLGAQGRHGSIDQQAAQIAIAALADRAELHLAPGPL